MSDQVIGGYALRRVLGRGGMGEVHLATTPTGGLAAVKVIRPELARDPAFRRRFEREVAAARRVARFCTAPVLDAGLDGDVAYLVTEYVKGPDLAQAVRDQGPLSGGNLDALAVGIATALSAIHAAGVIHRDLKPSNVLLSPLGPRVIDFGVAQLVGTDTSQAILGTPAFMAPEQARGETVGPFTDVFAWGGVIAFAGTGRLPFGGGSPGEVIHRITHEGPHLDGLDGGVRGLVEQALAKDPRSRPSVSRLLAELLGGGQVSPASATEAVERTWTVPLSTSDLRPSREQDGEVFPDSGWAGDVRHAQDDQALPGGWGRAGGDAGPLMPSDGGAARQGQVGPDGQWRLSPGSGPVPGSPAGVQAGSFQGSSGGGRAVSGGRSRRKLGWVVGGVLAVALAGAGVAAAANALGAETWPYESDF
ncbi:MAG TPA: serine/threonine-protein kinase, partial [Nonomuraea sp.]|nr:serine/threonine-protein kinase [Nonomuraea sp.]